MKYVLSVAAFLAAFLLSVEADAGNVRSVSGASATVAGHAAGKFQCLVNKLDASGYKIKFMGGYRKHGSVRHSKHPSGLALDINQTGRNRTIHPFPSGTTRMAEACGLFHGKLWRNADAGHFETRSPYMDRYSRRTGHGKKAKR